MNQKATIKKMVLIWLL